MGFGILSRISLAEASTEIRKVEHVLESKNLHKAHPKKWKSK
jgi:hypothetical protein